MNASAGKPGAGPCCPGLSQLPPAPPGRDGWPWRRRSPCRCAQVAADPGWPTIGVVTPSYNQGRFIEETIRSVLLQGYPKLEYVIIDGGSRDETVAVLRRYDPWLAGWVSEPDAGQSAAINRGWRNSRADVLAWLNADDLYLPGALYRVARAFREHPDALVVCGACLITDAALRPRRIKPPLSFEAARLLKGGRVPCQPAVFLRRSVVEALGPMDERLHYTLDRDYWIRLALRYGPRNAIDLRDPLALAREHDAQKSRTAYRRWKEERLAILRRAYASSTLPDSARSVRRIAFRKLRRTFAYRAGTEARRSLRRGEKLRWLGFAAECLAQSLLAREPVRFARGLGYDLVAALHGKKRFE